MLPCVAILCGGRGTRLREHSQSIPKPQVEIGGRPILWHVMQIYLAQGFRRFLLLTGFRSELIESFAAAEQWPEGTDVRCLNTGLETPTGGRLKLAADALASERFCATYADGVADIDLQALLDCHARHGSQATMTVVRPELQFGVAELTGDGVVRGFIEKPRSEHWINGGFFCFEPGVLELVQRDSVLEREPLEQLAGRASCTPIATRASERAWTPTRTRSCSTTCGRRGARRGSGAAERPLGARHRRLRPARIVACEGDGRGRCPRVCVIRRDDAIGSPLSLMGLESSVSVVHGDICTEGVIDRALAEYEIDSIFHLAAQTLVPTANRSPLSTFETNIRGTWVVLEAGRRARDRGLLRQGVRRPREASIPRALRARAPLPVRRLQGGRRSVGAFVLAHMAAAGGGDAIRQRIWSRR